MIPWHEIWDHEEEGFREKHEAHLSLASDIMQFVEVLEDSENIHIIDPNEYCLPLNEEAVEKIRGILVEERDRLIQEYNSLWE